PDATQERLVGGSLTHEWVIGRNGAVVLQAEDFAKRIGQLLSEFIAASLSDRDEDMSLAIKHDSRTVMVACRTVKLGRGFKDRLLLGPCRLAARHCHFAAHHLGHAVLRARFEVREGE